LDRPIVVGHMLGEVEKDKLICTSGSQEGDVVILTKGIAIEGTSIIAREKAGELREFAGEEFVVRAQDFVYSPGISVVKDALAASAATNDIHAMHDPTEGGLALALHELAYAANVGLLVEWEKLPIFPETQLLCDRYELDPIGLIASGALLITLKPADAANVLTSLKKEGIAGTIIGEVVGKNRGVKL